MNIYDVGAFLQLFLQIVSIYIYKNLYQPISINFYMHHFAYNQGTYIPVWHPWIYDNQPVMLLTRPTYEVRPWCESRLTAAGSFDRKAVPKLVHAQGDQRWRCLADRVHKVEVNICQPPWEGVETSHSHAVVDCSVKCCHIHLYPWYHGLVRPVMYRDEPLLRIINHVFTTLKHVLTIVSHLWTIITHAFYLWSIVSPLSNINWQLIYHHEPGINP